MRSFFIWYLLTRLTGSPVGSLALLLVIWWIGDRLTFQLLPQPARLLARWRRRGELRRVLADNPHDRHARFELAQILLEQRQPRQALDVLRPNIEAGDDDVHTAFLWGAALARTGHYDEAERALAVARQAQLGFRAADVDLELGRMRLVQGDFARAAQALRDVIAVRPGSVEARFYLARALTALGDTEAARVAREEGWEEYSNLPRFHRRKERLFAWRLEPWRPDAIFVVVVLVAAVVSWVLPSVSMGGGD
jgi:tetratricopeptide (TPR) repeat protein